MKAAPRTAWSNLAAVAKRVATPGTHLAVLGFLAVNAGAQAAPGAPAKAFLTVVARHPNSDPSVPAQTVPLGRFAGTRGRYLEIHRLRFSGQLPEGVSLHGSAIWGAGQETPIRWGEWAGAAGGKNPDLLGGLRLRLTGPEAHRWRLTYRAHVGFQGDTGFHPSGALLGRSGTHRFRLQGIEVRLVPRPAGPIPLVLEAAQLTSTESPLPRLTFLVVDLLRERTVRWSTSRPAALDGGGTFPQGYEQPLVFPFSVATRSAGASELFAWSQPTGGSQSLAVLVFEGAPAAPVAGAPWLIQVQHPGVRLPALEVPVTRSSTAEILRLKRQLAQRLAGIPAARRPGLIASIAAAAATRAAPGRPLRLCGGFHFTCTRSRGGRVVPQFGELPGGSKVRETKPSRVIGGAAARTVELRAGLTADLVIALREG